MRGKISQNFFFSLKNIIKNYIKKSKEKKILRQNTVKQKYSSKKVFVKKNCMIRNLHLINFPLKKQFKQTSY